MRHLLPALLVVALAVTGCADATKVLEDEASCPGVDCTDDARARLDAIADLTHVTGVEQVSRSYRLDRGSFAAAAVSAEVTDRAAARAVGEAVLGELDAWPDHEFAAVEATVAADPPVEVVYTAEQTADLTNPYFEACAPAECDRALADLRERMLTELDGLHDVDLVVRGGVLRVSGTADSDHYSLAASGAHRLVFDAALRFAESLEVEMTARGPLVLTLRLQEGLVCEQPPGQMSRCEPENSQPFRHS